MKVFKRKKNYGKRPPNLSSASVGENFGLVERENGQKTHYNMTIIILYIPIPGLKMVLCFSEKNVTIDNKTITYEK